MASKLTSGKIVRLSWPYTDLTRTKNRPALVLSDEDDRGDVELVMITTQLQDNFAFAILPKHYVSEAHLPENSAVRTDRELVVASDMLQRLTVSVTEDFVHQVRKKLILNSTRTYSRLTHQANRPGYPLTTSSGSSAADSSLSLLRGEAALSCPYAGRVFTEDEVEAAVSSTLDFWLTLGPEGEAFQNELADYLGVKTSILTNSGSSANLLAVSALTSHKIPASKRLRPGDEIITCAAGFPTTVAPMIQNQLVPVFLDNDPVTGNADLRRLEDAYVPGKTKAVMMAHTLGCPFDLATVCAFCHKYDLWLIEDNCDALGSTYTLPVALAEEIGLDHLLDIAEEGSHPLIRISESGRGASCAGKPGQDAPPPAGTTTKMLTAPTGTFGDLSTQSFYPPHHLTLGEGGAVNIVKQQFLKILVESFRDWGRDCWCASGKDDTCGKRFGWKLGELPEGYDHKYIYSHIGYNIKPLDPQAAIGRVQLRKLPDFVEARKRNWETLRAGLADLDHAFSFSLPTHATDWIAPAERETSPNSQLPTSKSHYSWDETQCSTDCSWFGFMLRPKRGCGFTKEEFAQHLESKKNRQPDVVWWKPHPAAGFCAVEKRQSRCLPGGKLKSCQSYSDRCRPHHAGGHLYRGVSGTGTFSLLPSPSVLNSLTFPSYARTITE